MEKNNNKESEEIVKSFEPKEKKFSLSPKLIAAILIVLLIGAGTGFFLAQGKKPSSTGSVSQITNSSQVKKGAIYGSNDTKTFKDTVDGTLKEGGINEEGQFHLERPGGESQNVYLTSSTVDLSLMIDRKIKVWGQTQKAQYAGWLMDVGRVEVLE